MSDPVPGYKPCPCGADDNADGTGVCDHAEFGYPWCVRCMDHHRHPETCPGITPDGNDAAQRFDEGPWDWEPIIDAWTAQWPPRTPPYATLVPLGPVGEAALGPTPHALSTGDLW